MTAPPRRNIMHSKWFMPLFCVGLGGAVLAALWIGGQLVRGLQSLAIMTGFGLFLLLAGRSETIRGLRGDGRDERFAQMDLQATALAGLAVILALIVAWLVAVARGQSGEPYTWLCAIAGLAYIFAVAFFRWRR